ncbi:MAG: tetratricopeptide repeat protein [Sulfuricaulis sp.]
MGLGGRKTQAERSPEIIKLGQMTALRGMFETGIEPILAQVGWNLQADFVRFRAGLNLAKLLALQQHYAQAHDLLTSLPADAKQQAPVRRLRAHAGLLRTAQGAPAVETLEKTIVEKPTDLEARYCFSAVKLMHDDYEWAMEQLLGITRRNDRFRDQAERDCLLVIFALLGEDDERVARYRDLLQKVFH